MRLTWAGLGEAATNTLLALLYVAFAWTHWVAFAARPRLSLVLLVVMETLGALLFLFRHRASKTNFSVWAWVTTIGGTFTPFLLRPADVPTDSTWGQWVQAAGTALALTGLASLGRSFGLLPALRSVREGGAYRVVRHPLYAGYTLQNLGYLASNPGAANVGVVALALAFQVLRIRNEERLLLGEPSYREYARRTRWRLVPFVF